MLDYYKIIDKYIEPGGDLYKLYTTHVKQVADVALGIGRRIGLDADTLEFIEEASMLHDIGVFKIHCPKIHCYGDSPYFYHHITGREILMSEGLPEHANVAARHFTPGTSVNDLTRLGLPEPCDFCPKTREELIIAYADLFSTKDPLECGFLRSLDEVFKKVEEYGDHVVDAVYDLSIEYGQININDLR